MNQWENRRSETQRGVGRAEHRAIAVIAAGACIGVAVIVVALSLLSILR